MKKPVKKARKLIVNNKEYWWRFKRFYVILWDAEAKTKEVLFLPKITGMSPDDFDDGAWKQWLSIKPSFVAEIIKQKQKGLEPQVEYWDYHFK